MSFSQLCEIDRLQGVNAELMTALKAIQDMVLADEQPMHTRLNDISDIAKAAVKKARSV